MHTSMKVNSSIRFSQDLRLADMTLPSSVINCAFRKLYSVNTQGVVLTKYAFSELGTCLVVAALSITAVGYFAAVLPLVLVVLYFIQNFYLRTSRQLRLLE